MVLENAEAGPSMLPQFPAAQQPQIIRANQRDLLYVFSLREQTENVLRSWLGSRWLGRWDKEVDFLSKLLYYGLTTGRAQQTLGEEYTNAWPLSDHDKGFPSNSLRAALVLLPALPAYLLSRFGTQLSFGNEHISRILRHAPTIFDIVSEVNLAIFYFSGTYYSVVRRALRIKHISSIPENPNTRPPSYSLLGFLIIIRLAYRLISAIRDLRRSSAIDQQKILSLKGKQPATRGRAEAYIDNRPISEVISAIPDESTPLKPAEEDENTYLDFAQISDDVRARRMCTLCLEERISTCSTECGHLFCWSCIVSWAREKAECPLCRQSLNATRLIPIYNL